MTGVAFHRGGRLLMALHLRPWKVLMKSLNVRKSLGVATALSLSLLGSLSSAAIASADETPDPSDSASVSAPADPSEGVDQSDVDDATPSDEASEDQGDVDDATPSDEASEDAEENEAEEPSGGASEDHDPGEDLIDPDAWNNVKINATFTVGKTTIKDGATFDVKSNKTIQVKYDSNVPVCSATWKSVPAGEKLDSDLVKTGLRKDKAATKVTLHEEKDFGCWEEGDSWNSGTFEISTDKLPAGQNGDLVIDFVGSQDIGMGYQPFVNRVALKDLHLVSGDEKVDKAGSDSAKAGSELTNGTGVAAGDKVGLPATGF